MPIDEKAYRMAASHVHNTARSSAKEMHVDDRMRMTVEAYEAAKTPAYAGETLSGDGKGCESTALEARSPAPAYRIERDNDGSSNGRTPDFESGNVGSTPAPPATDQPDSAAVLKIHPIPKGCDEVSIACKGSDRTAVRSDQPDECPACGGRGWIEGVQAACCGNLTGGGECRGDCAVPEQTQEQCNICGGSGTAPKRESGDEWQTLVSAPSAIPVMVETESGYRFPAEWHPNGSMDKDGEQCGAWVAAIQSFHPPCWSAGQCWESNEDERPSDWPRRWKPLPNLENARRG